MRKSVLRPGANVSTADPADVLETFATVDTARLRAAKLSRKLAKRLFVWEWNPANGLRRVRSSARDGLVYWHKACQGCDERGCVSCEYLGSVVDQSAPVERECDSV